MRTIERTIYRLGGDDRRWMVRPEAEWTGGHLYLRIGDVTVTLNAQQQVDLFDLMAQRITVTAQEALREELVRVDYPSDEKKKGK